MSRTAKADGAVETYTYDSQYRLVGYASDTTTASYAYDAMERRIAKTVDGSATAYVYQGLVENHFGPDQILLDFLASALRTRFVSGTWVDEIIALESYEGELLVAAGAGTVSEVFHDFNGSVIYLAETSSGIRTAYSYDQFGVELTTRSFESYYGFTGREHDQESSLTYFRARSYDSMIGQFIQSDPVGFDGGDLNVYAYVENRPLAFQDPMGLDRKGKGWSPGTNNVERFLVDQTQDAIREQAIRNVAEGVLGLTGYIVNSGSYTSALLEFVVGTAAEEHHCYPSYLSNDGKGRETKTLNRGVHRKFMTPAFNQYMRAYGLNYSRGRKGAAVRASIASNKLWAERISRQFYTDMFHEFGFDFINCR